MLKKEHWNFYAYLQEKQLYFRWRALNIFLTSCLVMISIMGVRKDHTEIPLDREEFCKINTQRMLEKIRKNVE